MKVDFLHPRDSRAFPAEVEQDTTAKTCLDQLTVECFIEPAPKGRPYALVVQRTRQQMLPEMTMRDAGVQNNDALAILQQEQGAAPCALRAR
jgi:hypothetical protein